MKRVRTLQFDPNASASLWGDGLRHHKFDHPNRRYENRTGAAPVSFVSILRSVYLALGTIASLCFLGNVHSAQAQKNLLPDPSIEETRAPNQFGIPYAKWSGWNFEGAGVFLNGKLAHSGKNSAEILGAPGSKLRLYSPSVTVPAGRYRFTCYIRGLDIGVHAWGLSEDINFGGDKYYPLKRSGTFGWSKLEIVSDAPTGELVFRIGMMAEGRLWVDDASLVNVPDTTPLTNGPVVGPEEKPVVPPRALNTESAVHCAECGYRNMPDWGTCYACGAALTGAETVSQGPVSRPLVKLTVQNTAPFEAAGQTAITTHEHAAGNGVSLQLNRGYVVWDGAQDWTGFDLLKANVFNANTTPTQLYLEIQDLSTTDYWTRVNYTTVIPPGESTLAVPTDLYVGEKSRPGRLLDLAHIKKFVLNIGDVKHAVYFDQLRLERDMSDRIHVPGLVAFSFGNGNSKPLSGFTSVTTGTAYSPGRGYGFTGQSFLRAYDVLQPDPLYEKGIFVQTGAFQSDLPSGKYHVFLNLDYPSGFWGEFQAYHNRTIKANGTVVAQDTLDLKHFQEKYFRFANTEDTPSENTFDKYQTVYFKEKEFDVNVKDGKLLLQFDADNPMANALSAIVIFPTSESAAGSRYLANLRERRRFYFDNYFKRVLPDGRKDSQGEIPPFLPSASETDRGFALFSRDWMEDISVNAVPRRSETEREHKIALFASAGQMEPIVFSVYPIGHQDNVKLWANVSDLTLDNGKAVIPSSAITAGIVSHRITRVTGEGTVYTISPRFIMPNNLAQLSAGTTVTYWFTLHTPQHAQQGTYSGKILVYTSRRKAATEIPFKVRVFSTALDELDVAAGPWGSSLGLPWFAEEMGTYSRDMYRKSLAKLREYGCTTFSGIPTLRISRWREHLPVIDYRQADEEMADARAAGFKSVVVNYNGGIGGFNNYAIDEPAMRAAGFTDYVAFLRAVLSDVDAHARSARWLPVAFNLCDEPIGDAAKDAAKNAKAWAEAAPVGMLTTGATSVEGDKADDPHLGLATALRVPNLNGHDEASLRAIHAAGQQWAFYNGGSRWTFGTYMFKCTQEYGMKFRLSWHWNAAAGDPYYALDCREDDYSWCSTNANRDLIPTVHFDREIRAGIDDYRYMLTLSRLIKAHPDIPAAAAAKHLLDSKLASFKLGERDHDVRWPISEYRDFRLKIAEAIEALSLKP